jgi:hypothetical protein
LHCRTFKKEMMNIRKIISLLTAVAFLLSACQKDVDVFIPDAGQNNGPDLKWATTITDTMPVSTLRKNLLIESHSDSFEVSANIATVNSSTGITCVFPPNSCVSDAGAAVTGKVKLELLLIKKKGDMIRMDKPTISNNKMLVSGGEVFIKISQNGHELKLAPGIKISVKFSDTPLETGMKLFYGDTSNGGFNWTAFDTSYHLNFSTQPDSYQFYSDKLHWLNCDYIFNATNLVKVADSLPENFTNVNSTSYIVFNTLRSVLPLNGDPVTKKFISTNLAAGLQATVVVISRQGNDYYLGHEGLVTGVSINTSGVQQVRVTPVKKSLADIQAYLSTL